MMHTNSPAACETAGHMLLSFLDRGPSSQREQLGKLAEFLIQIGAIRDIDAPNRQAPTVDLIAE